MIDFDFIYLQPKSVEEALQAYTSHSDKGESIMYFGGGTEFISRSRRGEVDVDVVIDIKHIPDCQTYKLEDEKLFIGSGITLSTLTDKDLFPLLSSVSRGIATKTARNKITVGGNLCSNLPYKEAYLPFLLAGSTVVIASEKGLINRPIEELIGIQKDEFLVQIITDEKMTKRPFSYFKRTRQSRVNYPVLTMATMEVNRHLHMAVGGLCDVPVHFDIVQSRTWQEAFEKNKKLIPKPIIDDELASREYREFVFKMLFQRVLNERKEAK